MIVRLVLALLVAHAVLAGAPCGEVVCVEVEQQKDRVTFYALSRADGTSILFSATAVNMEPASPPLIARALSRGRTELLTLRPVGGKPPQFEHGYIWGWGVVGAVHDAGAVYRLPFERGRRFQLFQGPNGTLSHGGKFAYDFPMPAGTPVCAARGGVVVDVVDRFDEGGPDPKLVEMANSVTIIHDDGTLGVYLHLLRGGMRVVPGDRVQAGAVIALSGNSGWSTGPHLHFEVRRNVDGATYATVPVKFRTADGAAVELAEGTAYRAD